MVQNITWKLCALLYSKKKKTIQKKKSENNIFAIHLMLIDVNRYTEYFNIRTRFTGKYTVISPDFLMWKFAGKAQFPHSFG